MLRSRRRRAPDVAHWQWLTVPHVDARAAAAGPPARLHPPLSAPAPRSAGLAAQRVLLSRFDAVVVHTEHGAARLRDEVGLDPERVHVIPHGPLDYLTRLPDEQPLARRSSRRSRGR